MKMNRIILFKKAGLPSWLAKEERRTSFRWSRRRVWLSNQKQENVLTTNIPKSRKGHYAFGHRKPSRRGVFVDIGLKDKDMVVSLDELPTMRELWPKRRSFDGQLARRRQRAYSLADEKNLSRHWVRMVRNRWRIKMLQVPCMLKLAGTYLLTDDFYIGFVHPSERYQEPRLGEVVKGRVIGARPDGVLNLSLKPRAHEAISNDAAMVLTF